MDTTTETPPAGWTATLPAEPAERLIGRTRELDELTGLLAPGGPRLVTILGVGGVGKTRLALAAAHRAVPAFDGRVAWAELEHVAEPALLVPALAALVGVGEERGHDTFDRIGEELGDRPALFVLDTVEHLATGAGLLGRLLGAAPRLHLLATSRIPLGLDAERTFGLGPLPLPEPADAADPEALLENPAIALLVERARAVRPDAEPTGATAQTYIRIVRQLDGIPTAIELAAAGLRVLEPHQLLDRLTDQVGSLDPSDSGHLARRWSLRASMDRTLALLPDPLRRLYRRLSVIVGAFDVETAERILAGGELRGLAGCGTEVAEGLRALNDAYLLRHAPGSAPGQERYEMLRTVRIDARDRLEESGEDVVMRWAHAYHFLELAEAAERDLPTEREPEALERLEQAHDDLTEALDWSIAAGDGTFAVRLAGALAEFWRTRGYLTEGRIRLQSALAYGSEAPAPARRKALAGAGLLASYQGDYTLGGALLREALAIAREGDDREAVAQVLNWLGTNAYGAGQLDEAERHITESLAIRRELGDPGLIAVALNSLGGIHHFRGDLDRALEVFAESLELKRGLGNENAVAVALTNIGLVERDAGRPDRATEAFDQAVEIWERTGDRQRWAVGLHNAALVDLDLGRHDRAAERLREVVDVARTLGDRGELAYAQADLARVDLARGDLEAAEDDVRGALRTALALGSRVILPLALEAAGSLAAARGDDERAVRLWAAASADRAASGFANMPADARLLEEAQAVVRSRLGAGAWDDAWTAGASLALDAAVAEALA